MPEIINIAAYRFARLEDLKNLRQRLLDNCRAWGLKGTILLSAEGINLFVAGGKMEIDSLVTELRAIPGLESLAPKYSESDQQPFSRMLVRIKKEIIAFGVEGIEPGKRTSPKLPARELKRWLDEGREVTLLDTRNEYEVKLGTFRGAKVLEIDHFKEFPEAVSRLPETMKQTPIVMFCTGGIRCEKAGPYMEREGFQNIFQLDGGILKYFEEVGADHYDGECFVFDQRVGVDPALGETESAICFVCQTTLDLAEQADPRYVVDVSCPFCYRSDSEKMQANIALHQAALDQSADPLPGSAPHFNERPLRIPSGYEGCSLLEVMNRIFLETDWLESIETGQLLTSEYERVTPARMVQAGERYLRMIPGSLEPPVDAKMRILYESEGLVVVEKPTALPLRPEPPFQKNTLQYLLSQAYQPQKIQPVETMAMEDSGLVICARSRHFAKLLKQSPAEFTWRMQVEIFSPDSPEFRLVGRTVQGSFLLETDGSNVEQVREKLDRNHLRLVKPERLHAWKATVIDPANGSRLTFESALPDWAAL